MMYQQQNLLQPAYNMYSPQQLVQPQNTYQTVDLRRAPAVDGIDDAYRIPLPPNQESVIAYDIKRPIMYLITVNGLNRTVQAYDYVVHVEQSQSQQYPVDNTETAALESINNRLTQIEEALNGSKSNSSAAPANAGNSKYNKSGNGSNASSH